MVLDMMKASLSIEDLWNEDMPLSDQDTASDLSYAEKCTEQSLK